VGSIIITTADIADANLIYNEDETRRILKYFWPGLSSQFDALTITNDVRRFAQTMLIAAIDGSYAMGYVAGVWDTLAHAITHPNGNIADLAKRLARNYIRHWWRHATQQDLEDPRIYDSVRNTIAYSNSGAVQDMISNAMTSRRGSTIIVLMKQSSPTA
jgi:hypothetical protein